MYRFASLFAAFLVVLSLVTGRPARAQQSLDDVVQEATVQYGRLYAQPAVDALGANLNSGFFHKAKVGGGLLPLVDVYVGVKAFGTLIPDSDRSADFSNTFTDVTYTTDDGRECTAESVSYSVTDAPTVFGESRRGVARVQGTFDCETGLPVFGTSGDLDEEVELLPGAVNTPIAPLAVPQAGVGLPMIGTHVAVRYLPRISYGDAGSVQFGGVGVQHEVSSYIPLLPFAFSVHGFYQSLSVEDESGSEVSNASTWAAGAMASKSLLLFTVYGGLQVERATVETDYIFDPPSDRFGEQRITFDVSGDNTFRAMVGASFGVGPVVLNVDLSQGQRTVLSTGLGVSL